MSNKRLSVLYITFNTFIISGVALFTPILYIFLVKLGYSYTEVGVYLSVFWGAAALSELPSGILADTIGQKKIVMLSCVLRAVGLAMLITDNFVLLMLSGLITGIAEAMLSGSLSSWYMNQLEDKSTVSLDRVFSRVAFFGALFSLCIGFVSAQFLFKVYLFLPVMISVLFFVVLAIVIYFVLPERKLNIRSNELTAGFEKVEQSWMQNARNIWVLFRSNNVLFVVLLLLIAPTILDIGPSNQWQVAFSDEIGFLWIGISVMGILTNLAIPKIPKIGSGLQEIIFYMVLDIPIIVLITFSKLSIVFFMLHIIIFTIMSIKISVYMHQHLVKDDALRSSFVSTFYTLESLISMTLLPLNGLISEIHHMFYAWNVFVIISIVLSMAYILILVRKQYLLIK
ncbi:MAG: MFS transporter [Staphylococcus rostri]|uniref:MFS transporter n=1 Tax=Staphylococcus rostri TaxID=522262 RepID=UPI0026E0A944|nr:MFS transporter [Staphylococcus rostri]MDO5374954.1 MFS transporter [Staphylococcus rostri]